MSADLFISYAWTSTNHREWVHLLAAQLKALGFDVLLDAGVDYGDDLNGFMRSITDAKRVLLVVDRNYVERADTMPTSVVVKESHWISETNADHELAWLTAIFIDNPECTLQKWITVASAVINCTWLARQRGRHTRPERDHDAIRSPATPVRRSAPRHPRLPPPRRKP